MTQNSGHQEAHGIGQIEKQLKQQAEAAEAMQGVNEADQEILQKANQSKSELDEIIED